MTKRDQEQRLNRIARRRVVECVAICDHPPAGSPASQQEAAESAEALGKGSIWNPPVELSLLVD